MLSFKYIEGIGEEPIQIAEAGDETLYYYENCNPLLLDNDDKDPIFALGEEYITELFKMKYIKVRDIDDLRDALIKNKAPKNDNLIEIYDKAKERLQDIACKDVKLNSNVQFDPLPDIKKERNILYVAGASGSGKSYVSSKWTEQYHAEHPKNKIYLFSKKFQDPAFDSLKYVKRILINDEFIEEDNKFTMKELRNTLCIFDDCDTFEKKYKSVINQLIDDILNLGRADHISCIISVHKLTNYKETRGIIMETHQVVFYLGFGNVYHINRFLKTYAGLSKNQIKRIIKSRSRWVLYNMHAPNYILTQNECYLITPTLED